jgi:cytochrome c oxidase assembly protein subunit 11
MTPDQPNKRQPRKSNANRLIALALGLVVASMLGLSFAAVPLYQMFCQTTGYGGTTQRALAAPSHVMDQVMTVRFDANVSSDLGWSFKPMQSSIQLKIGENKLVFYEAKNLTDKTLTGSASFNVTPEDAGAYFDKIQCFCFTEQTLQPGQVVQMPVSFFIDPAILDDPNAKRIHEVVLSYTFFKVDKPDNGASAKPAASAASKPIVKAGPSG